MDELKKKHSITVDLKKKKRCTSLVMQHIQMFSFLIYTWREEGVKGSVVAGTTSYY